MERLILLGKEHSFSATVYRADIDGLRALAVLAVLWYHTSGNTLPGGFAGVDIFFVISGFLITGMIQRSIAEGNFRYRDFYVRRICRIFPALLLVLGAIFCFGWNILEADAFKRLGRHIFAAACFAVNFALKGEKGHFQPAELPLLHLWSLSLEEQFYIVWPPVLVLMARRSRSVIGPLLFCTLLSFALYVIYQYFDPAGAFYYPWSRGWELMIGSLLACRPARQQTKFVMHAASIGGISFILLSFVLPEILSFPGLPVVLTSLGACLFINAGEKACMNRLLTHPRLVEIGLISYSLYLWHWPLLALPYVFWHQHASSFYNLIALLITYVIAKYSTLYVEIPLRSVHARMHVARVLATLMIIVAILSFIVWV